MRTTDHRPGIVTTFALTLCLALGLTACEGPGGPTGPGGNDGKDGVDGTDGTDGKDGKDGINALQPGYVLSTSCAKCHQEHYDTWKKTGHGNALTKVSGAKPTDPPYTTWPAQPPTDDKGKAYAWTDVSYIIGGFGWRAVFVDAKGYVIPGAQAAYHTNADNWGPYETAKAPGTIKFTCAECHTTRWRSFEEHEVQRTSADLEGAAGKWMEDGVACERCHGPGGNHKPGEFEGMIPNRNSSMCGKCHGHKPLGTLNADNGLLARGQQYNEISATKMKIVQCVDCHDPHRSARWDDDPKNPAIVTRCESCHYKMIKKQKVPKHLTDSNGPTCVDCHMPRAVKSAVGNPTYWTGDLRSHLFRINTDMTAPAVSTDGKSFMPYLTINFACRQCHSDPSAKSDALLKSDATGYHD
jgi:hypothetical protein